MKGVDNMSDYADTDYKDKTCGTCRHRRQEVCRYNPPQQSDSNVSSLQWVAYPPVPAILPACSHWLLKVKE
jgi:hypothetical protein